MMLLNKESASLAFTKRSLERGPDWPIYGMLFVVGGFKPHDTCPV